MKELLALVILNGIACAHLHTAHEAQARQALACIRFGLDALTRGDKDAARIMRASGRLAIRNLKPTGARLDHPSLAILGD